MLAPLHQLVEDDAGNGAVGHSVSGITRCNPDVLIRAGILSDVRHKVYRLYDLARPAVLDLLQHWETLASPLLEAYESLFGVQRLTGLVIFAADDEHLVIQLVSEPVFAGLDADVMVGIGRVPVEAMRHGAFWNSPSDDVGAIGSLLAVDDEPVVHRSIGTDDNVVGADYVATSGRDLSRLAVFDFLGVHAGVNAAAIAEDRARKALQVLQWVEGCLARKAKGRSTVPERERDSIDELRVGDARAMRGVELTLEILARFLAAEKEVALDSLELAIDVFHRGDAFDAMNS